MIICTPFTHVQAWECPHCSLLNLEPRSNCQACFEAKSPSTIFFQDLETTNLTNPFPSLVPALLELTASFLPLQSLGILQRTNKYFHAHSLTLNSLHSVLIDDHSFPCLSQRIFNLCRNIKIIEIGYNSALHPDIDFASFRHLTHIESISEYHLDSTVTARRFTPQRNLRSLNVITNALQWMGLVQNRTLEHFELSNGILTNPLMTALQCQPLQYLKFIDCTFLRYIRENTGIQFSKLTEFIFLYEGSQIRTEICEFMREILRNSQRLQTVEIGLDDVVLTELGTNLRRLNREALMDLQCLKLCNDNPIGILQVLANPIDRIEIDRMPTLASLRVIMSKCRTVKVDFDIIDNMPEYESIVDRVCRENEGKFEREECFESEENRSWFGMGRERIVED